MRLATCDRCSKAPVMVNAATVNGVIVGEFCGDCWDSIPCDDPHEGGHRLRVRGRKPINGKNQGVVYPTHRINGVEES